MPKTAGAPSATPSGVPPGPPVVSVKPEPDSARSNNPSLSESKSK